MAGPAVPAHQLPGALHGVPDVEQLADQKKIQYRPHLINGCLAAAGLRTESW
jgi:hypothetical protein